jgi:hypothetical protein
MKRAHMAQRITLAPKFFVAFIQIAMCFHRDQIA